MSRRWVPALVALDAVLVAAVLVVALVVVRPGGTASPEPPTGTATGTGAAPVSSSTPGPPHFQLPSGNIACAMTADGVTCTIASRTFTPPAVPGCTGTVGHTVVLDSHGVSVPCVTGTAASGSGVPTLFYGATSTVGQYTCTSATNGVTCTDGKGVGFRLAREALVMLP